MSQRHGERLFYYLLSSNMNHGFPTPAFQMSLPFPCGKEILFNEHFGKGIYIFEKEMSRVYTSDIFLILPRRSFN